MNPARNNSTGRGLARSSYSVSADLRKTKAELAREKARTESAEAAMHELICSHDNLYLALFGEGSNPKDDIAADATRAHFLKYEPQNV